MTVVLQDGTGQMRSRYIHHACVQVGVHSALANKLAKALLEGKLISSLLPYDTINAEVKLEKYMEGSGRKRSLSSRQSKSTPQTSRLDFLLHRDDGLTFVEVKSVTLAQCMD